MAEVRGQMKNARKAHACSKCGRVGHNIKTCSFKRRVGSPRPGPLIEQKASGLEVVLQFPRATDIASEVNAELNTKTCACPTCGSTFTGRQVFDALRESKNE